MSFLIRRALSVSARNSSRLLRISRPLAASSLQICSQPNSASLSYNRSCRHYCSESSGNGVNGGNGSPGDEGMLPDPEETALVQKNLNSDRLFKVDVPDRFPDVPLISVDTPLFPLFTMWVRFQKNEPLKELLRRKVRMGQPYVGVFCKRNKSNQDEIIHSLDDVYNVGTFAVISAFYDDGKTVAMVLSAIRRIKILEPITEDTPPINKHHIGHINGRRRNNHAQNQVPVDSQPKKPEVEEETPGFATPDNGAEVADKSNVIFVRTDNLANNDFEMKEELQAKKMALIQYIREIANLEPLIIPQVNNVVATWNNKLHDPTSLCDMAAVISVNAETEQKQKMLEEQSVIKRTDLALDLLSREKNIYSMREQINKQVHQKISEQHKKFLLQEQLKAIKKELGLEKDDKQTITEKLEEKMKTLIIPEHAMKVIKEEQTKLNFLDPHSSEFSVTRNYLEWLVNVPWGKSSKENLDLKRARQVLDEDHYGMKDVKDRILEFIAVRNLKKSSGGKILCFHGPPGTGKTSIAKSIARVLNRKYYRFSVGGMTDVAEIKGHRRTYVGAMPGKIIQALKKVETENPLILIDEIDKIGGAGYHGDPASALLELLDPEQNANFMDHFLDVSVDLSKVLFICTANVTDTIPEALADRMELIEVSGYVAQEKVKIAENYLVPLCRDQCALPQDKLQINPDALETIIKSYCRESGVRNLQKHIEKIFRKAALKIVDSSQITEGKENETESEPKTKTDASSQATDTVPEAKSETSEAAQSTIETPIVIDNSNLKQFLGREKFTSDRLYEVTPVGVIMGLAWTSMGGAALYIETTLSRTLDLSEKVDSDSCKEDKHHGEGSLEPTGNLGDVMKESMRVCYTVAKRELSKRDPKNKFLEKAHIHVHVPEGATPKDGPSAGVTITSALMSLALNQPVTQNIAMTGEISLTGKVLPVGGIREKVIAAKRAGVNTVILPDENKKDYEDLADFIKENLEVHFVSQYDDVFKLLFPDFKH